MVLKSRNDASIASKNLLYFTLLFYFIFLFLESSNQTE